MRVLAQSKSSPQLLRKRQPVTSRRTDAETRALGVEVAVNEAARGVPRGARRAGAHESGDNGELLLRLSDVARDEGPTRLLSALLSART